MAPIGSELMERRDWDLKWRDEQPEPHSDASRFLAAEMKGMPPGRALDLACGTGRNAVWLAESGWRVTGVDFSEVALQKARGLAHERGVEVEWVLADLREWSAPSRAFDLVLVLYLQLPAGERCQVLARAAAALAPGGTLLVVGHDLSNLTDGWGGPRSPAVLFTPADVVPELPGLVVDRAERVTRSVEDEKGRHVAIDALVKAVRQGA